jgi:hypothetical protein
MQATASDLTTTDVTSEAATPDELLVVLEDAGFVGARERAYAGGRGAIARATVRGLTFQDDEGAATYLAWLSENLDDVLGSDATLVAAPLPGGAWLAVREPSGCCHGETPVYLGAWQRGPVVWTLRASGPRIRTGPVVQLVKKMEEGI